tara:strand:+ start:100 stop:2136 length:2037 start_codon:yes stop_codon:yes gene_type:complete
MAKKIIAIVQSRTTSTRFPNKVLSKIGKNTVTQLVYKRLKKSKLINDIAFTIPSNFKNNKLFQHLKKLNVNIFRGSESNVLDRYFRTATKFKASIIVRITGDCPLVDSQLIDKMLRLFHKKKLDYLYTLPKSFPDGFDVEIFSLQTLSKIKKKAKNKYDLEHVTSYIRKNPYYFKIESLKYFKDFGFIKVSLDKKDDLSKIRRVFKSFRSNIYFTINDIFKTNKYKQLFKEDLKNNINFLNKTKEGQELWKKAKKVIPGGNMLISKNPERYLPNYWPTYFKSAKGCKIKDYDGNTFLDISLMGVGTNVLGYGNSEVDAAVKSAVKNGNMSSLNCKEEILLAEKLIELHPEFDMVKFARTGGEANSVAIRIARAASGRDNVAICGYHGWHDWYLSANLNNNNGKNLETHLIKGLEIEGVPKKLKKTSFPFEYGNYSKIEKIVKEKNIGVIKMEVCRNTKPDKKFLKFVRNLATKNKIVLIFDECTTGFRQSLGGLHKSTGVIPDIVIFGKALGNGYAITAIVGKKNIMESSQRSFISSTFWTERIGPTAALKTIEYMEKHKTWLKTASIGKKIQKKWSQIAELNKLKIKINGIPSLTNFVFESENNQSYKTLITQEMFKNNILASNSVYCSIKHDDKTLKKYFETLNKTFKLIKNCEEGFDVRKYLQTKVSIKEFKRLN